MSINPFDLNPKLLHLISFTTTSSFSVCEPTSTRVSNTVRGHCWRLFQKPFKTLLIEAIQPQVRAPPIGKTVPCSDIGTRVTIRATVDNPDSGLLVTVQLKIRLITGVVREDVVKSLTSIDVV
jgi:hypothetical protein